MEFQVSRDLGLVNFFLNIYWYIANILSGHLSKIFTHPSPPIFKLLVYATVEERKLEFGNSKL